MKKLLALLFIGCLSVSLVGMKKENSDNEELDDLLLGEGLPKHQKELMEKYVNILDEEGRKKIKDKKRSDEDAKDVKDIKNQIIFHNLANDLKREDRKNNFNDYVNEIKHNTKARDVATNQYRDDGGFEQDVKNVLYNTKVQEEATKRYNQERGWTGFGKDIGGALVAKTGMYILDGMAQRLAGGLVLEPLDAVVIRPVATAIHDWWYKDQIEQAQLAQGQQKRIKSTAQHSKTTFNNANKSYTIKENIKNTILAKGLDPEAPKKAQQDIVALVIELGLPLDFERRARLRLLSKEDIAKVEVFNTRKDEILKKYPELMDEDNLKLYGMYAQAETVNINSIAESLVMIQKENNLSRMNHTGIEAEVSAREQAFMTKMEKKAEDEAIKKKMQKQKKQENEQARLQADREYEERKRLRLEKEAEEKREWEIQKSNEQFLWNQQHGTQKWSEIQK